MTFRSRGVTLLETVLSLAIGIGVITGGLAIYHQARQAALVTDLMSRGIAISYAVRDYADDAGGFDEIPGIEGEAVAGSAGDKTNAVRRRSLIPSLSFHHISVFTDGDHFDLEFTGLDRSLCNRLLNVDFGPRSDQSEGAGNAGLSDCAAGGMTIRFTE